jgi:hypothetical protein
MLEVMSTVVLSYCPRAFLGDWNPGDFLGGLAATLSVAGQSVGGGLLVTATSTTTTTQQQQQQVLIVGVRTAAIFPSGVIV